MKLLLTGANSILASDVIKILENRTYDIIKTDKVAKQQDVKVLDITDKESVFKIFEYTRPEIVLHFAAETDVDLCQSKPRHAFNVNAKGTENISLAAKSFESKVVYISTAMVFDGKKPTPYIESDETSPVNIYGKSKLEGERLIENIVKDFFIIRISWLIGSFGIDKKFVHKTVQQVKSDKKEIEAANDRFGSPTFATDFACNLVELIDSNRYGLYHMSNSGGCSRYELACKVVEYMGLSDTVKVKEVTSDRFPLLAPRPISEIMVNKNLDVIGLDNMPEWEVSLKRYIERLCLK